MNSETPREKTCTDLERTSHARSTVFFSSSLRSTDSVLDELHRFFEDDPDDHQLEIEAEGRLKTLYSCLVVSNDRVCPLWREEK